MNWKNFVFKRLKPIDLIGLAGLLAVVFLYIFYAVPFRWSDLISLLVIAFLLLFLSFGFLFLWQIFSSPEKLKNCFSAVWQQTGIFARQIIPFLAYIFLYNQIHDLTRKINDYNFDAILIKIDHWLLNGRDLAVIMQGLLNDHLSSWLALVYNGYFFFFLATPLILFLMKKHRALNDLLLAVVITVYLSLVDYILVPCVGPILAQQNLLTLPLWQGESIFKAAYWLIIGNYAGYKNMFHCFPSLHAAVTLIWLIFAWRHGKVLFIIYLPLILSTWLATVYLRWHYLVDILAGFLIAIIALILAPTLNDWWERKNHYESPNRPADSQ